MYDINDIADFVERDDSYGINDKEWGKILRNKANEIGCDHRKGWEIIPNSKVFYD
mgnify:CR=1 FL=1